jgi:hypothetical protein
MVKYKNKIVRIVGIFVYIINTFVLYEKVKEKLV